MADCWGLDESYIQTVRLRAAGCDAKIVLTKRKIKPYSMHSLPRLCPWSPMVIKPFYC